MVLFHKDNHVTLILSFTSFRLSLNFLIQAHYLRLVAWIVVIQLLAGASSLYSQPGVWYDTLVRSPLTPPGFVFGLVWPLLYLLLAYYGWHLWEQSTTSIAEKRVYLLQMMINLLWSSVFFALQQVSLALLMIAIMILMTIYLILKGFQSAYSAWVVLIPYLLWLLFAFYLTSYIAAFS